MSKKIKRSMEVSTKGASHFPSGIFGNPSGMTVEAFEEKQDKLLGTWDIFEDPN